MAEVHAGGLVVATNAVAKRMKADSAFNNFVRESIARFKSRDWGDTCEGDKAANDRALASGDRLLAVYIFKKSNTKIWIITEEGYKKITVLFPNEY